MKDMIVPPLGTRVRYELFVRIMVGFQRRKVAMADTKNGNRFDDENELVPLIFRVVGSSSNSWKAEAGKQVYDESEGLAIAEAAIARIRAGIKDSPNFITSVPFR
jgi:hypothetical protein